MDAPKRVFSKMLLLVAAIFCCTSGIVAQSSQKTDNQVWPEIDLDIGITKRVTFNMFTYLREGHDFSYPVNDELGVGFTYKFNDHFSLTPLYRGFINQTPGQKRVTEHFFTLDGMVRASAKTLNFADRNRLELGSSNDRFASFYRNRLEINRPVKVSDHGVTPYVQQEFFYNLRENRIVRDEFTAGLRVPVHQNVTVSGYYLRQFNFSRGATDANVIGAALSFSFNMKK